MLDRVQHGRCARKLDLKLFERFGDDFKLLDTKVALAGRRIIHQLRNRSNHEIPRIETKKVVDIISDVHFFVQTCDTRRSHQRRKAGGGGATLVAKEIETGDDSDEINNVELGNISMIDPLLCSIIKSKLSWKIVQPLLQRLDNVRALGRGQ